MVWFHIIAGSTALIAGAVALSSRKGARLHRKSGMVFVCAMLLMLGSGGVMAAIQMFDEPVHRMNVVAATVTAYFVVSALLTVTHPVETHRRFHVAAMCVALAGGALGLWLGYEAIGDKAHGPAPAYFGFAALALLAAALDLRMLRGGALRGVHRIARHLWRMMLALLIATASFFLGQADEIPVQFRHFGLLSTPVILVIASLLYWLIRVFLSRRFRQGVQTV